LRRYETTFIVNPQADDAAIDRQVNSVLDVIKNNGGSILRENRIGTRRMAYEIAGLNQGFYASIIFEAETGVLSLLERHYQLEEPFVRYLTIKYEGPLEEEEEAESGRRERRAEPAKAESKPEAKTEAKPEAESKEEVSEPEKKTEEAPAENESGEETPKVEEPEPKSTESEEEL
jgi:small subunit ribosomal protein S6